MKVDKNQIDALNAQLTLVIEKEDYEQKFKEKIDSYKGKAHLKGFRKGKTSSGTITKMYGGAAFQETISDILTEKVNEIISGDEYNIIGEPLIMNGDSLPDIDYKNPQDYTYQFEVGLEPEFEVKGSDESDTYNRYVVEVSEAMVDEEVENIMKKMGSQEETDDVIVKTDVVYFSARELYKGNVLVDGRETEVIASVDKVTADYADQLCKLKKADTIDVDIYNFEEGLDKAGVEKHLLKIEKDEDITGMGSDFRLTVDKVIRVKKGEFNQASFDSYFGKDAVKSPEEAREKIKNYISEYFEAEAGKLVSREIMEKLMEINEFDLPETFIRKWITQENEMTDEQFQSFLKEMKWRLVKKKLINRFGVEVKEDEIFNYFVNAIRSYSPYMDEATLKNTVFSLMKNKEQLNTAVEGISSEKLFDEVRKVVSLTDKNINKEEFFDIVKTINEKAALKK